MLKRDSASGCQALKSKLASIHTFFVLRLTRISTFPLRQSSSLAGCQSHVHNQFVDSHHTLENYPDEPEKLVGVHLLIEVSKNRQLVLPINH